MEILTSNTEKVPTKSDWQEELRNAFRDVESLLSFVGLERSDLPDLQRIPDHFPILVPRSFAKRMKYGDAKDPLLSQVLAFQSDHPVTTNQDWSDDPVQDQSFEKVPGLLHKYHGRVLLLTTGACAIHCRYCFRQNFDYNSATRDGFEPAFDYICADSSVTEVILSGGDPLLRSDRFLGGLISGISEIPHVRRIRIHTRTPVVIPSRLTPELLDLIGESKTAVHLVLHINHDREIDQEVANQVRRLKRLGVLLLNQSVLLRGINDDFQSQFRLCESLVDLGIVPYYLHVMDPINGGENYLVPDEVGTSLIAALKEKLPGYAVPKLVREIPMKGSKTEIQ